MDDYQEMQINCLIDNIKQDPFWMSNESEPIRSNKDMMLKVLNGLSSEESEFFLNYLYENLTSDREMVLACVNKNGVNLRYAEDSLKNDKEIVFAAIKNNQNALSCIGSDLEKEIGSRDPLNYLGVYFLQEKLEKDLPNKKEKIENKLKI